MTRDDECREVDYIGGLVDEVHRLNAAGKEANLAELFQCYRAAAPVLAAEVSRLRRREQEFRRCACGIRWRPAAGLYGTAELTECPACVLRAVLKRERAEKEALCASVQGLRNSFDRLYKGVEQQLEAHARLRGEARERAVRLVTEWGEGMDESSARALVERLELPLKPRRGLANAAADKWQADFLRALRALRVLWRGWEGSPEECTDAELTSMRMTPQAAKAAVEVLDAYREVGGVVEGQRSS